MVRGPGGTLYPVFRWDIEHEHMMDCTPEASLHPLRDQIFGCGHAYEVGQGRVAGAR